MKILAIDTVSQYCSIAIIKNNKVVAKQIIPEKNKHAELLICMIEKLLKLYNLSYDSFYAFVVTIGPGSFIGIRIGMAALQGISLVTGRPLYGVSKLAAIAFELASENNKTKIQTLIETGKNMFFYQQFSHDLLPLTLPNIAHINNIITANLITGGEISCLSNNQITIVKTDASHIGLLAMRYIQNNNFALIEAQPLYIR